MMRVLASVSLALLATLLWQRDLRADRSVVLLNPAPLFAEAVEEALAPWPVSIKKIKTRKALSESMPGARTDASRISEQEQGSAVVWLTSNEEGHAIWMYDASDDRVVVRELLVRQPLDKAGAASAALSLKSLLMHSHSAPEEERFGAQVAEPDTTDPPTIAQARKKTWAVEGFAGIQQGLSGDRFADPRLRLGFLRRHAPLELGARLALGPGHRILVPELAGDFTTWELSVLLRYMVSFGEYGLGISLQPSIQRSALQGTLLADDRSVDVSRFNPSVGAGIELFRDVGSLRLGIGLSSTYMLRSQRYLVSGESVLDLAEINVLLGTSVTVWAQ